MHKMARRFPVSLSTGLRGNFGMTIPVDSGLPPTFNGPLRGILWTM